MKKIIIPLVLLLVIPLALAVDECKDSVLANKECSLVTPYISYCSTYTLSAFYSNGTSFLSDQTMSQIGSTGIYNYTINFTTPDTYIIKSCDDSTRSIIVINNSESYQSVTNSLWSYIIQIYYNTLYGGY